MAKKDGVIDQTLYTRRRRFATLSFSGELSGDWAAVPGDPGNIPWSSRPWLLADQGNQLQIRIRDTGGTAWGSTHNEWGEWLPAFVPVLSGVTNGPVMFASAPKRAEDVYRDKSGVLHLNIFDTNWASARSPTFEQEVALTDGELSVSVPYAGAFEVAVRKGTKLRVLRYPR